MPEASVELCHYRNMREWQPAIGDIIIKHGWIFRTKWFGVVNFIQPDGSLQIIKDGMMRLLVMTPVSAMPKKSVVIHPSAMTIGSPGAYTVMQQDAKSNAAVWYV